MTTTPPKFVQAMGRIQHLATRSCAERSVLLAALRWVNFDTGELWPALDNWAKLAGVSTRSLQRILRRLSANGLVTVVRASSGGITPRGQGLTSRFHIPALMLGNPGAVSGFEPRPQVPPTPTVETTNPDRRDRKPRHSVRGSTKEQPADPPTTQATGVVGTLRPEEEFLLSLGVSSELLRHPGATPQRLAWIASEAKSKRNPAAWAASAIRGAFEIPSIPVDPKEAARRARDALLSEFDAMPEDEQRSWLQRGRALCPNLPDGLSTRDSAMRGAVLMAMRRARGLGRPDNDTGGARITTRGDSRPRYTSKHTEF